MKPFGIGLIGCGNISETYARLIPLFRGLKLVACADRLPERAKAAASVWGVNALSPEALFASPDVDIIVNLTVPAEHFGVSRAALEAGKHVWTEKPLTLTVAEAKALQNLSEARSLRIGSAPDTFLGGAHQQARAVLDAGRVGHIVAGSAAVLTHGMEAWHPDPDFFFRPGGGPVFDLGPYYLASLVALLGPVRRVAALGTAPSTARTIGSGPRKGETVPVLTPTNIHALLEFRAGATITFSASWDVWANRRAPIELYGSEGTLILPDPNYFDGVVEWAGPDGVFHALPKTDHPFGQPNQPHETRGEAANYRAAGLADMAAAIREGRPHRCSLALASHVVEVMEACLTSGEQGTFVTLSSNCERPASLDDRAARDLVG